MNIAVVDMSIPVPNSSVSPVASVDIGDRVLHFVFSPDLVERATGTTGHNLWAVTVQRLLACAPRAIFMRETPPMPDGSDPLPPAPALVLATLASDLSVALAMPADEHAAVDWLFAEGYATWPSDAIKMHRDLSSTLSEATALLDGTEIDLQAFHAALEATPVVLAPCMFRGDACPASNPPPVTIQAPSGAR